MKEGREDQCSDKQCVYQIRGDIHRKPDHGGTCQLHGESLCVFLVNKDPDLRAWAVPQIEQENEFGDTASDNPFNCVNETNQQLQLHTYITNDLPFKIPLGLSCFSADLLDNRLPVGNF